MTESPFALRMRTVSFGITEIWGYPAACYRTDGTAADESGRSGIEDQRNR